MKMHKFSGYYVAVEGLDGSGSDMVCDLLERQLRKQKISLFTVKEPSSGPVGLALKKMILRKNLSLSPASLAFLFAADRAWLMEEKIIPALKEGKLVVSDRCLWSSVAYQSQTLPIHWLLEINKLFIFPNVTYFIDVSPKVCACRIKRGEDELQIFSEEERLADIQEGYHWIFNKHPYWLKVIEGERDQGAMVEEILSDLLARPRVSKILPRRVLSSGKHSSGSGIHKIKKSGPDPFGLKSKKR